MLCVCVLCATNFTLNPKVNIDLKLNRAFVSKQNNDESTHIRRYVEEQSKLANVERQQIYVASLYHRI